MMKNKILLCFFIIIHHSMYAQIKTDNNPPLSTKENCVVTIAAFTANGDLLQLKTALNDGLNAGLKVNAIKEVLLQLYAYTGFPRSLNALNTLMAVLKERKANGINDPEGAAAAPLPAGKTKLQFGTEMQTKLLGQPVKGAVYEFVPAIDQFLKEHLFADIFGRNNLNWKTRELVTIAALATLGNVEPQLRSHFTVGLYNGLTEAQLFELVSVINNKIGVKEGNAANQVLQNISKQNNSVKAAAKDSSTAIVKKEMIIRLSALEIHADSMEQYIAILKEEAEASIRLEQGVISIFPMYQKDNPQQVRILEIYASVDAYKFHLTTPHFKKYKQSTLQMVKSLQLIDMEAIDAATMVQIFSKQKMNK